MYFGYYNKLNKQIFLKMNVLFGGTIIYILEPGILFFITIVMIVLKIIEIGTIAIFMGNHI